jgi:uncharacterized protein (TIGR02594 family)
MNVPFYIGFLEFGIKGIAGAAHNPEVQKYFKDSGFKWVTDDETAWCAAFINWCLAKAGLHTSNSLGARSFLKYGVSTDAPRLGDLVVFWRIKPTGPYGHVGFFVAERAEGIYVLGGNQSNQVNITLFPKSQVLGYRRF